MIAKYDQITIIPTINIGIAIEAEYNVSLVISISCDTSAGFSQKSILYAKSYSAGWKDRIAIPVENIAMIANTITVTAIYNPNSESKISERKLS